MQWSRRCWLTLCPTIELWIIVVGIRSAATDRLTVNDQYIVIRLWPCYLLLSQNAPFVACAALPSHMQATISNGLSFTWTKSGSDSRTMMSFTWAIEWGHNSYFSCLFKTLILPQWVDWKSRQVRERISIEYTNRISNKLNDIGFTLTSLPMQWPLLRFAIRHWLKIPFITTKCSHGPGVPDCLPLWSIFTSHAMNSLGNSHRLPWAFELGIPAFFTSLLATFE